MALFTKNLGNMVLKKFQGDIVQWLRGFYCVAMTGGLTRAAEILEIKRSAISYHLKMLEQELGVTLFDRSQEPMRLTADGQRLLEATEQIFALFHDLRNLFHSNRKCIEGRVGLAAQPAIALLIRPIMGLFLEEYPAVRMDLHTGTQRGVLDLVESRYCDMGLVAMPGQELADWNEESSHCFTPLYEDAHVLATAKNSKYVFSNPPALEEIAKAPLVCFDANDPTSLPEILRKRGLHPKVAVSVDSDTMAADYIKQDVGVGVLREMHCFAAPDDLNFYPFCDYVGPAIVGIVTRRGAYISPQAALFMERLTALKGLHMWAELAFSKKDVSRNH